MRLEANRPAPPPHTKHAKSGQRHRKRAAARGQVTVVPGAVAREALPPADRPAPSIVPGNSHAAFADAKATPLTAAAGSVRDGVPLRSPESAPGGRELCGMARKESDVGGGTPASDGRKRGERAGRRWRAGGCVDRPTKVQGRRGPKRFGERAEAKVRARVSRGKTHTAVLSHVCVRITNQLWEKWMRDKRQRTQRRAGGRAHHHDPVGWPLSVREIVNDPGRSDIRPPRTRTVRAPPSAPPGRTPRRRPRNPAAAAAPGARGRVAGAGRMARCAAEEGGASKSANRAATAPPKAVSTATP